MNKKVEKNMLFLAATVAAVAACAGALATYFLLRPTPLPPKSDKPSLPGVEQMLLRHMRQRGVSVLIAGAALRQHAIDAAHGAGSVRYVTCRGVPEHANGYSWLCAQLGLQHKLRLISEQLSNETLLFLDHGEALACLPHCDSFLQGLAEESCNFGRFRVFLLVETPAFARRVVSLNAGEKFSLCRL